MKNCLVCSTPIPEINGKYCSRACYATTLTNTVKKRMVWVDDQLVPTTVAITQLSTNAYSLVRMILDDNNTNVRPYPSKEAYVQESIASIYKKFPLAPTKEQIFAAKENRVPLKRLAKDHGITQTTIANLCLLHDIESTYHQVAPSIHRELEDIHSIFDEHKSAERIAKVYGVSPSLILQKAHAAGVDIKPSFSSSGEEEIRAYVESLGFSTTKRKTNGYEIDIYISEKNIGIEFNGVYWHSQYEASYHLKKYQKARSEGIRLVQIWDIQWNNKPELIKRKIANLLGVSNSTVYRARSLTLSTATMDEVRDFYERHHIQGAKSASYHLVLKDQETIMAALSVSVSAGEGKIERYATAGVVSGGFERLFKHARQIATVPVWRTFVDLMWSDEDNNQYCRYGFIKSHCSRPNYYWVKNGVMHSRMNFQKHKLTHFPNYDPEKSESTIMQEAKYFRVYDCGNAALYLK